MNAPWTCPVCRRGLAPHVASCDHGVSTLPSTPPVQPVPPSNEELQRRFEAAMRAVRADTPGVNPYPISPRQFDPGDYKPASYGVGHRFQ